MSRAIWTSANERACERMLEQAFERGIMSDLDPSYDLRAVRRVDVVDLFEAQHGYKSLGASLTYCFAVYESGEPIAAYAWQPPPPGCARSVCEEAPHGVLSLSRMVAVNKKDADGQPLRKLKHISKPLRRQMRHLIDRTRWPVLVTFSDEGEGHNGFTYECSGWTPTTRTKRPISENADGQRCSSYSNGKHGRRDLIAVGHTWIQRWENRACPEGKALEWMTRHGWHRVPIVGKTWASGRQAYTYVQDPK